MEKSFENSVFIELKNYKGFVFNPLRIFDVLYNEKSEDRTPILEDIVKNEVFSVFAEKLKTFRNGSMFESFESLSTVKFGRRADLQELCEYFAAVVDDFIASYDEDNPYFTYCYAFLLVSIILATPGYFPDVLLYKFVHFCRRNSILKI